MKRRIPRWPRYNLIDTKQAFFSSGTPVSDEEGGAGVLAVTRMNRRDVGFFVPQTELGDYDGSVRLKDIPADEYRELLRRVTRYLEWKRPWEDRDDPS